MQQDNQIVVFVKLDRKFLDFYYLDGHKERTFLKKEDLRIEGNIHEGALLYHDCILLPLNDIYYAKCKWVNPDIDLHQDYLYALLHQYKAYHKAEKVIFEYHEMMKKSFG